MKYFQSYLAKFGKVSFAEKPLCEVDLVIFSQLPTIDLSCIAGDEITLAAASDKYAQLHRNTNERLGIILSPFIIPLFRKLATLERYKDIILTNYKLTYNEEKEFDTGALTIKLDSNKWIICFAGTSDCIVSWKEDFKMLYTSEIDSQREAIKYLNALELAENDSLYLVGHSKGGNLSMYSAAYCDDKIKQKIEKIYSLDGPGFCDRTDGAEISSVKDRLVEIVPEKSVIGRLFLHVGNMKIVKSDLDGLYQHDVFSWEIENDEFVFLESISEDSNKIQKEFDFVLKKFSPNKRAEFVNALFELMLMTGAKSLIELEKRKSQLVVCFFKLGFKSQTILNKVFFLMFTRKTMGAMLRKNMLVKVKEINTYKKTTKKIEK